MKITDIKNKDLSYMVERIEPYFASSIIIRGMLDKRNVSKVLKWKTGVRWLYTNNYFFVVKKDSVAAQKELDKKFKSNGQEYAEGLVTRCFEFGDKLLNAAKQIEKQSARRNISRPEMSKLLDDYLKAASHYMIFQNIVLFEKPIARLADKLTKKYSRTKKGVERLLNLITVSSQLTASEREQDDFLRLCLNKDRYKLSSGHAREYGWLSLRFFIGQPWINRDVVSRLKDIKIADAKKELEFRINERKIKEKLILEAIADFSKQDKELVKLIRDIVFLRTQRTDFFQESSYYVQELVKKIAKELNLSYEDVLYLSASEIILSLKRKIDYQIVITQRKKGFVVFFDYDNDKILEARQALNYISQRPILLRGTKISDDVIKGKIGFRGKTVGKVKIVKSDKDNKKVVKGNILVAIMTTTNFIPAMRKAAAFITDEGGITCHAAILAREMKKPCVIGTATATKVLKDGDLVEVDANKGIVKILKRA